MSDAMKYVLPESPYRKKLLLRYLLFGLIGIAVPLSSFAAGAPENLGLGLKQLVENYQNDLMQFRAKISDAKTVQADSAGRVVVNIHLDGTKRVEDVAGALEGLGLEIIAIDPNWRSGVVSAWLPISQATAVAELAGVRSVMLAPPPRKRVGSVTAESAVVEHSQQVNTPGLYTPSGILGNGITVGLVSDSYDKASGVPRASVGVGSGDLPGTGNPDGYTTPVVVLQDDNSSGNTDEGRGMAEIVHDIAPAAHICFSAGGASAATMAQSIRNLRTNAACDIIADDLYFTDEPYFSDGPISQAIDDVVTSTALAGKKVVYFSAAGNEGNYAYSSDVHLVTAAQGLAAAGILNFSNVPSALYAGGFHNLNPGGPITIAMMVTTDSNGQPNVALQWDDPFDVNNGVTTDYNLLVFSATGTYNSSLSGTDNNFSTDEPIELLNPLKANTTYYFVISLASSAPPTATHLHLSSTTGESLSGPYIAYNATNMFGHPTAANANAVGAYVYNTGPNTTVSYNSGEANPPPGPYRPGLEDFTSTGGSLAFYFNSGGTRLTNPVIRQKPEISAADGVDTSFFPSGSGNDYDNDNFPNFFGTSAAAPTAAAIAALVLDAAGGPGSRTPDQIRSIMEQSTFPHDLDPNFCQATASNSTATVQVSANGNSTNDSASSPNFFTVAFTGNSGQTLNQLVIDLTNTPLVFDESVSTGFPFTVGSNPGNVSISSSLSASNQVLTLTFGSTFTPGKTISFGIDRDLSAIDAEGNSADLLAGADIKATVNSSTTLLGAFANQLGAGFTFADGYGLVNAQAAVESVLGPLPPSTSVAANLSTRGLVQTGNNVLIGGFIVQGGPSKNLIIRALGPSLAAFGVANALADPTLELHDSNGTLIASDDNWQDDPNQATKIQAAGLAPANASESALAETLVPASYTAIVRGVNNTTGVGLFEVYDIDSKPPPSQLINISTRGLVQTGDDVLIGGFVINGSTPTNVLVRAIGPSLTAFGISNALADPLIELHDSQGNLITSNDNWQQDSLQATQIQATGLAPGNALESAIVTTLSAGSYTAIVRGANATTGVGLVEVYNLK
jgi:hypothetical protein